MKQPVWHVIVLAIVSFKLYFIYWAYKNWRDLCAFAEKASSQGEPGSGASVEAGQRGQAALPISLFEKILPAHLSSFKNASPHLRGLLCFVPYLNNYLFFTLALGIARLDPDKKSFAATHPYLSALAMVLLLSGLSMLSLLPELLHLPQAFYLLFFLFVIPLALVQNCLNRFWDSVEEPGLLTRHGFSLKELLSIILGGLYLGYVVSGFLLDRK